MLIESLAQKTRLAMMTVVATIAGCAVICGFTVWCCISLVNKERQQIYVLTATSVPCGTRPVRGQLHHGGKSTHQILPSVLLQPAARQRLYQVDARQGDVHGGRYGTQTETGVGRERLLFGHHILVGGLHHHVRLHPAGRA